MKYKAFTLAEILITLGVIGVVAVLTMPALIANIDDKILEVQRKKAENVIANAVKTLMAQEGVTSVNDLKLASCTTKDCVSTELRKVFKIVKDIKGNELDEKYKFATGEFELWNNSNLSYGFVTNDGIIIGVPLSHKPFALTFISDVNGKKNPNTASKDLCKYSISNSGSLSNECEWMYHCTMPKSCEPDEKPCAGRCIKKEKLCRVGDDAVCF